MASECSVKIDTRDSFWIVTDPTPLSEIHDIVFMSSLARLELQFRGGLQCDKDRPTLYTDKSAAFEDGQRRLDAREEARYSTDDRPCAWCGATPARNFDDPLCDKCAVNFYPPDPRSTK